jgi:hypothetical protein
MKTMLKPLLLTAASVLLLGGCCRTRHAMQWEYTILNNNQPDGHIAYPTYPNVHPKLGTLGSEGWELVTFNGDKWIFKRPKK